MFDLPLGWNLGGSRPACGSGFVSGGSSGPTEAPRLASDSGEGHPLVCAATGTGKGRNFAPPSYPGNIICFDIKSELYQVTQRHRRTLGPIAVIA